MKIYVETLGNEIVSDYCFKGYVGAVNRGYEVEKLSLPKASLMQDKLREEDNMFIGCVSYMEYFFKLKGVKKPDPISLPVPLWNTVGREFRVNAFKDEIEYPAFVKPWLDVKKFTGFVAKSEHDFKLYPELGDWDGPYLVCNPIELELVSEWRCFIHRGKVVNVSYYTGTDPKTFPDRWVIGYLTEQYEESPVAYTLDVAVDTSGITHFIECNDMWAIGPYGIDENDYFDMLKDRWLEIINIKLKK